MELKDLKEGTLLRSLDHWYSGDAAVGLRLKPGDIILFVECDKLWHLVGGEWHFYALGPDGTKKSFGGPEHTSPWTYFEIVEI